MLVNFLKNSTLSLTNLAIVEVDGGKSVTYGQLWDRVDALSYNLRKIGLSSGETVALSMPNSIDWIVTLLSVIQCGAIASPIRQSCTPSDIKRLISCLNPALFVGDSRFINRSLPFDLFDEDVSVVVLSKKHMIKEGRKSRAIELDSLAHSDTIRSDSSVVVDADVPAIINFTYRGLGYPLGAVSTHSNLIQGTQAYVHTAEFKSEHRVLGAIPFSYAYPLLGCVLAPLATNSTIVVHRGFSIKKIIESIKSHKIDVLTGVPSMYSALLQDAPDFEIGSMIKYAFCGGSVMPENLYEQMRTGFGIDLRQGYGLTESLPITCNPIKGNRPESLGKILTGVKGIQVKIFDETGNETEFGRVGEIVVSGPTVASQYYRSPIEATQVWRNGWFHTGDLGYFDEDRYLHFAGLKKRIAKVAGNMVDLVEVENRILKAPGIQAVKVYAVPDADRGHVIAADVVFSDDTMNTGHLRRYLKNHLAPYKIPRTIRVQT